MKHNKLHAIWFSPTHTSERIARSVAQGITSPTKDIPTTEFVDLTHHSVQATYSENDIVLIAVPVYGGHIAPKALQRMTEIHGTNTPAIGIVVYGNRAFDQAANELKEWMQDMGFCPIAIGAFIGEHSYSTSATPIAEGRPNQDDLEKAKLFGEEIFKKLQCGNLRPVDLKGFKTPRTPFFSLLRFIRFIMNYRRQQKKNPKVYLPTTDAEKCIHCGECVRVCPVDAITLGDELKTDPTLCIRCCACVKVCHKEARTFSTPFAEPLSRNFQQPKPPVTRC